LLPTGGTFVMVKYGSLILWLAGTLEDPTTQAAHRMLYRKNTNFPAHITLTFIFFLNWNFPLLT